jgi:hypothetical protein
VLLLPVVLLYGLTFFATMQKQRNLNYGMRKDLRINLGKFDSLLALIAVFLVVIVLGLSSITNGTKNSVFAGKNEAQIYAILINQGMDDTMAKNMAKNTANSAATLTATQQFFINAGTMLTGQREMFETKNAGMGMSRMGGNNDAFKRATAGFNKTTTGVGGGQTNITRPPANFGGAFGKGHTTSFSFQNNNGKLTPRSVVARMSGMVTQIFGIITKILLVATFLGGIIVCIKTNKHRKLEKV